MVNKQVVVATVSFLNPVLVIVQDKLICRQSTPTDENMKPTSLLNIYPLLSPILSTAKLLNIYATRCSTEIRF